MISDILERFQAAPAESWMVGDSLRDLEAGAAAGCKTALVLTGKGRKTQAESADKLPPNTLVFDDLLAFSQFLIKTPAAETA